MGGRKGYNIEKIIGKSPRLIQRKKDFITTIESDEPPRKIIQTSLEVFSNSDKIIDEFSNIIDTFDFIIENYDKPSLTYDERRKIAAAFFSEIKDEKELDIPHEVKNIIVSILTKYIRRGERK